MWVCARERGRKEPRPLIALAISRELVCECVWWLGYLKNEIVVDERVWENKDARKCGFLFSKGYTLNGLFKRLMITPCNLMTV